MLSGHLAEMSKSVNQVRGMCTSLRCAAVHKTKADKKWLSPNGYSFRIVSPNAVEPIKRVIPGYILRPPYAEIDFKCKARSLVPTWREKVPKFANIRTDNEIEKIRESCKIAKTVLEEAASIVKEGITPQDIDNKVFETCIKLNCYPSPLNYMGFPRSVTTSVNNVACHAIPDRRPLEKGDIISIDVSIYFNGYHGDTCKTVSVGHDIDPDAAKLLYVGSKSLEEAIKICRDGVPINKIGKCIEKFVTFHGMVVNPNLCGHGIGEYFHGPPDIVHVDVGHENNPERMASGMVFTIEPCIIEGNNSDLILMEDEWTLISVNNYRSVQFEHTILIKENEAEVLT